MNIGLWMLLLVAQNAAFTLVSRARNSGSYGFHAVAGILSNGIWFASQLIMIGVLINPNLTRNEAILFGVLYVIATVTGSLLMHWVSINYFEKGKRKVGA